MKKTERAGEDRPTRATVARFQMLYPMLESALDEMRALVKKSDAPLSRLKVEFVNQILTDTRELLAGDSSVAYLILLDDETLPLTSDAVLVLGRFKAAMDQFRTKHWSRSTGSWLTRD